jgi:hypothetical protein
VSGEQPADLRGQPVPPRCPGGERATSDEYVPKSSGSPVACSVFDTTTRHLIGQYARRMTIEQRLAEIIRAFCADALSSTVNLNVDLDVMLAVLAQALTAALRARLPGYAAATPDTIQRQFLETPGQIITSGDTITVRLERRAYSPVLRKADLPAATTVP